MILLSVIYENIIKKDWKKKKIIPDLAPPYNQDYWLQLTWLKLPVNAQFHNILPKKCPDEIKYNR